VVRGINRNLAENTYLKIVTGEGSISGTCYLKKLCENSNLKMVTGELISGTWY